MRECAHSVPDRWRHLGGKSGNAEPPSLSIQLGHFTTPRHRLRRPHPQLLLSRLIFYFGTSAGTARKLFTVVSQLGCSLGFPLWLSFGFSLLSRGGTSGRECAGKEESSHVADRVAGFPSVRPTRLRSQFLREEATSEEPLSKAVFSLSWAWYTATDCYAPTTHAAVLVLCSVNAARRQSDRPVRPVFPWFRLLCTSCRLATVCCSA